MTDVAERLDAEQEGSEWNGATPKEGTYSIHIAREIYQTSLRRKEDAERVMDYIYGKESFDRFTTVLSSYPEIRQDVSRFKDYIDREVSMGSQTLPQK